MKKKTAYMFVIFAMMIFFAGCGENTAEKSNTLQSHAESVQTETSADEKTEEVMEVTDTEISDKNVTTNYAGESFTKSIFATGGNMLYVCGIKEDGNYFLGYMEKEDERFEEFVVEMDEGMRPFNMFVDKYGQCHILWMSVEEIELDGQSFDRITYEKSFITVVDSEGQCVKEINVSDLFSSERKRPFCFAADLEGNYYIENEKEMVQILNDGTKGKATICEGWIEGIGIGKSGSIYCTYQNDNGDRKLAKLEKDSFRTSDIQLPSSTAIYAGVFSGTDTEVLIINKESGVFACNENDIENRISGTDLPVSGTEIAGYGILADGRACIMEQQNGETIFYYIPAGK